jgi:uncharacterized protein (TIGR02646 family)
VRHISFEGVEPDPEWLAKAEAILDALKAAKDRAARNQIIDDNAMVWGELKNWLLGLSHQKCWFSEARDCYSHWDVEHFRPKKSAKDADGTEYDGYWWLAFDWKNLRICGNVGNRKKGTYFPIRDVTLRCEPLGDLGFEDPQLLDPADADDPGLLSFNVQGTALPAPHVTDDWEKARVEYSIEKLRLDFPALEGRRKMIWAECWGRAQEYIDELAKYHAKKSNVIARDRYKRAAKHLLAMIQADSELSMVARACLESSGDLRLKHLLWSA